MEKFMIMVQLKNGETKTRCGITINFPARTYRKPEKHLIIDHILGYSVHIHEDDIRKFEVVTR